jgi:ubiquinone/menaquinone biosynthesis C-methylase UbiE
MKTDVDSSRSGELDPQLSNIARFFDSHGDLWIDVYRDESDAWYQYFPLRLRERYACALIHDEKRGAAIDLGCGTGHALLQMKAMGFKRVIGVDISDRMIAATTELLGEHLDQGVEVYQGDVRDLTMIETASIDACTALGVIEYLENDDSLLQEIHRILKPGGAAVIQTRNYRCIRSRTVETGKRIPLLRSKIWYREHRPEVFRRTAEAHGFNIEREVFTHFYALFPLNVIPGIRSLVRPLDNYLSKKMERLSGRPSSRHLASMYIPKLRKAI